MKRLGISIYPKAKRKSLHIDTAAKRASLVFLAVFFRFRSTKRLLFKFTWIFNAYAHRLGFEIILDVNPQVFKEFGIGYGISFFKEIGADGFRLI